VVAHRVFFPIDMVEHCLISPKTGDHCHLVIIDGRCSRCCWRNQRATAGTYPSLQRPLRFAQGFGSLRSYRFAVSRDARRMVPAPPNSSPALTKMRGNFAGTISSTYCLLC